MTLKLEVGKTYVTADGTPVKIVEKDSDLDFQFNGSNGDSYRPDGGWAQIGSHEGDLVSELQEPGETPALAKVTVAFHRQQFLDRLMLTLIENSGGDTTVSGIADAFAKLAAARDAAR